MAVIPAGTTAVITEPIIHYAPLGTPLIHVNTPYDSIKDVRDGWALQVPGWTEIRDTVNGVAVTARAPKVAIVGERFGRNRSIASGDDGVQIGLQSLLPQKDFIDLVSSMAVKSLAARAYILKHTVTTGASSATNITVDLPGLAPVSIAVLATDTAAQVATKIAGGTYAGWTAAAVGAEVTFTKTTAGYVSDSQQGVVVNYGSSGGAGTSTVTQMGRAATEVSRVSKSVESRFMLGIHGILEAGTLYDEDREFIGIAYGAQNTANAEHAHRWAGADAPWRPTVTLECEPYGGFDAAQVASSGVDLADLDPAGKFDYFAFLKAA